jgi:hypothetical protein
MTLVAKSLQIMEKRKDKMLLEKFEIIPTEKPKSDQIIL